MYSDNDIRLYHSAKGSTWKNHKYSAKKANGGKTRYIYQGGQSYAEDVSKAKKEQEAERQLFDLQTKYENEAKDLEAEYASEIDKMAEIVGMTLAAYEKTYGQPPSLEQELQALTKFSGGVNSIKKKYDETNRTLAEIQRMKSETESNRKRAEGRVADKRIRKTR